MLDASRLDRNPADFTPVGYLTRDSSSVAKEFYVYIFCFTYTLNAIGVLNSLEELCIHISDSQYFPASVLNPYLIIVFNWNDFEMCFHYFVQILYIYIVFHGQICFVLSELISVARH